LREKSPGRILLCTYLYSPAGSPRNIRWDNFVKILSARGWEIDVLTIQPGIDCTEYDENFHLPPNRVRIIRTYAGFFYPRLTIGWLPFGFLKGFSLLKACRYDLLISVSLPFVANMICFFLKKIFHLPWIADFGDPWVFNPTFLEARKVEKTEIDIRIKIEANILKNMEKIIVTTEETKNLYLSKYTFLQSDTIKVIPQGYSPEEYDKIEAEKSSKFRLVYTGVFYRDIRNPSSFFQALQKLNLPPEEMEVLLIGNIAEEFKTMASSMNLKGVQFLPQVAHNRAIALQKGASVLLFLGNKGALQLPAKIFEYLAARRPIIAIKMDDKDLATPLIERLQRGIIVKNDPQKIADTLYEIYRLWKEGKLEERFLLNEMPLEYSWKNLADSLEEILFEFTRKEN